MGRSDRLGTNISCFVAQIIYAVHHDTFILYDRNYINHCENDTGYNQQYNKSIFIKSLFYFIDKHNEKLTRENKPGGEKVNKCTTDFFETISRIVLEIKIDYFCYFKSHIYPQLNSIFEDYARENNYRVPFDIKKTIIVHLRLDDGRGFPDYDGLHCAHHFRKNIDDDKFADNCTDAQIKSINPHCNRQSPLSKYKLDYIINIAKLKYPTHEVILITNPGENTDEYPYRCIQNVDESFDLYLLCNCEVVVLSRSNFALSSLFFNSMANDVYIPLWGHLPCYGLFTKYDNTSFHYFI